MCTKVYQVYGWKAETESTNLGQVYLIGKAVSEFGIRSTGYKLRDLFVLNFVNNGKIISLHNVIRYVKRIKSSFDGIGSKRTPCAPLKNNKSRDPRIMEEFRLNKV